MAEIVHRQTSFEKLGLSVSPDVAAINTGTWDIWQISRQDKDTFLIFMGDRPTNSGLMALEADQASPNPFGLNYRTDFLITSFRDDLEMPALAVRDHESRLRAFAQFGLEQGESDNERRDHLHRQTSYLGIGPEIVRFFESGARQKWVNALNSSGNRMVSFMYDSLPTASFDKLYRTWSYEFERSPSAIFEPSFTAALGEHADQWAEALRQKLTKEQEIDYLHFQYGNELTWIDFKQERSWPGYVAGFKPEVSQINPEKKTVQLSAGENNKLTTQIHELGDYVYWDILDYRFEGHPRDTILRPLVGWDSTAKGRRLLRQAEIDDIVQKNPKIAQTPAIETGEVYLGGMVMLDVFKRSRGLKIRPRLPLVPGGKENDLRGASTAILPWIFQRGLFLPRFDVFQRMERVFQSAEAEKAA